MCSVYPKGIETELLIILHDIKYMRVAKGFINSCPLPYAFRTPFLIEHHILQTETKCSVDLLDSYQHMTLLASRPL